MEPHQRRGLVHQYEATFSHRATAHLDPGSAVHRLRGGAVGGLLYGNEHDVLLDMHFSGLTYTVLSLFFSDPDMHPLDFSLLNRREADEEPEDDVLMQKAAGLAGGVRFGPDGNEVIPASPDVADMTEDDVMLMTVSEGIAGGVRYG